MQDRRRAGRIKAIAVIIAISLLALASPANAVSPGNARIDITSQRASLRTVDGIQIIRTTLYNKRIVEGAIGTSLMYCLHAISASVRFCQAIYRFPLGQIVASGIVASPVYYRFAVTGGTGFYGNVGGQVTSTTLSNSPKQERLIFNLKAF